MPSPRVNRTDRWLLPVLLLLTFVAYQPAWHGGVLWDDDGHLTSPALRGLGGLWRIWFEIGATQQYYPVVHSVFWILDRIAGADTLAYHLVTIGLHAALAWLVAIALRRLEVPGARLAAVIFALHPVHVESVAWITELKNTLSGVLFMLAALAYLDFDRERRRRSYAMALGLFALALSSKSVTATLPAGLLIVFWWKRGRLDVRRDVYPLVPFFSIGLAAGLMTAWVERTFIGAAGSDFHLTAVERVLVAGRAIWFYLGKLMWPADLVFIYPRWTIDATVWWQYVFPIAALGVTYGLWRFRGRSRAPLAAWLFFAAMLGPALGFIDIYPFRYSFVADHFQYLASVGIIALAAAVVATWIERSSPSRELLIVSAMAVPLGLLTWQQSHQYVNAAVLYETTLDRNPQCWMAHNNLAALALAQTPPQREQALEHVQAALRLNPANDVAHNNLGLIYQQQGQLALAVAEHSEAARLNSRYADAHTNLGVDLALLHRWDEAIAQYQQAIRLDPRAAGPHHNLALLFMGTGRIDDAIAEAREAVRLNPSYADARSGLGSALTNARRFNEAIPEFREAVRLQAGNAIARNNLAAALTALGRLDEAAAAWKETARLFPASGLVQDNLGLVLLRLGRHDEAASAFQEAVRLAPEYGPAHEHHAKILQDAGQLPEAIAEYQIALKYTPESAEAHNNLGVALATSGRVAEAAGHFAEAVRLKPDFAEARANLARARGRN